jgi:hypothetical protein
MINIGRDRNRDIVPQDMFTKKTNSTVHTNIKMFIFLANMLTTDTSDLPQVNSHDDCQE